MGHKRSWAEERLALGTLGETTACSYLIKRKYSILERNYRTPFGEIDIVAREKKHTVFVEVKTRSSASFGPPFLSINEKKRIKLIRNALYYLKKRHLIDTAWRIDIVSIIISENRHLKDFVLFKNAVSEDEPVYPL